MADKKITELNNITGANLAEADEFVVVDITADETKAITFSELKTAFDTGTGFVRITGDTMTGNLSFGDTKKAIFGAESDLQIYHDGLHSYLKDAGTGDLYIQGEANVSITDGDGNKMFLGQNDGEVQLYYNGAEKLNTTNTGIDVTGTVTADGLTVDSSSSGTLNNVNFLNTNSGATTTANRIGLGITNSVGAAYTYIEAKQGGVDSFPDLNFYTGSSATKRLEITNNGDIRFYEDTGTTAKFFWDASAESLGIGQGVFSGTQALNIKGEGIAIKNDRSGSNNNWSLIRNTGTSSASNVSFVTGAGEAMVLAHNKNVGIGTDSPSAPLHIEKAAGNVGIQITSGNSSDTYINFGDSADTNAGLIAYEHDNNAFAFHTNGSERMRINELGYVTKPSQPSFKANYNGSTINVAAFTKITHNRQIYDVGGVFDPSNSRFTAPVDGKYVMLYQQIVKGNYTNAWVEFYLNNLVANDQGGRVHYSFNNGSSAWNAISMQHVFDLSAGDYIEVYNGAPAAEYHGDDWHAWSGYLLG